eukprot:11596877-Heterocapsa_arctica.AAC.1
MSLASRVVGLGLCRRGDRGVSIPEASGPPGPAGSGRTGSSVVPNGVPGPQLYVLCAKGPSRE